MNRALPNPKASREYMHIYKTQSCALATFTLGIFRMHSKAHRKCTSRCAFRECTANMYRACSAIVDGSPSVVSRHAFFCALKKHHAPSARKGSGASLMHMSSVGQLIQLDGLSYAQHAKKRTNNLQPGTHVPTM